MTIFGDSEAGGVCDFLALWNQLIGDLRMTERFSTFTQLRMTAIRRHVDTFHNCINGSCIGNFQDNLN
jgi:hypothetical protein